MRTSAQAHDTGEQPVAAAHAPSGGALDATNPPFICAVLFLNIVEYFKKPVSQQLKVKEQFHCNISAAIEHLPVDDRIILDTGDGAAINFLGDPEEALLVAMNLAQSLASTSQEQPKLDVRIGINLGPVRLVRDSNGQPNIIGDGINVAERVMSFARPGQVLVSGSYHEVVTRVSEDNAQLFAYQGSRTDMHVRDHEIYEVSSTAGAALNLSTRVHHAPAARQPAVVELDESTQASQPVTSDWLTSRWLAYSAALVSGVLLIAAVAYYVIDPVPQRESVPATQAKLVVLPAPPEPQVEPPIAASAPIHFPPVAEPKEIVEPAKRSLTQPAGRTRVASPTITSKPVPSAPSVAYAPAAADPEVGNDAPAPWRPVAITRAETAALAPSPAPAGVAPSVPSVPTALITLAISPWGEILVDGKSMGVSPPTAELELAPGSHRIEIRNGDSKPYFETLELAPNQTVRIKHKFSPR